MARHERKPGDFVFVAHYCPLHCKSLQIPNFDCHVRGTRSQNKSILVKSQKLHDSRMTFKCSFVFALFKIPEPNCCVFGRRGCNVIKWVKHYFGYFSSMALHAVLFRLSRLPVTHFVGTAAPASEAFRKLFTPFAGCAFLYLLYLLFKVPHLLLKSSQ